MADSGTPDSETLYGSSGNDEIEGLAGGDLIFGSAYGARPFSEDGSDLIDGGEGNDRLVGGTGSDVLIGGDGDDDMRAGPNNEAQGDYEYGAGAGLYASGMTETPSDILLGGDGTDSAYVGYAGVVNEGTQEQLAIRLVLNNGAGMVKIDGLYNGEYLESIEKLTFNSGDKDDYVTSTDGDDELTTNDGNDHIEAKDGDDSVTKGLGILDIDGGEGVDFFSMNRVGDTAGIDWDGETGELKVGGADKGAAVNFENFGISGTEFDDTLAGRLAGYNIFFGGAGDDTLTGGSIADSLYGGADDDIIEGGGGNDALYDGGGKDNLSAGAGDDDVWFVLSDESDANESTEPFEIIQTLDGGSGSDTLHVDFLGSSDWDLTASTITGFETMVLEGYPFSEPYSVRLTTAQLLQFKSIDFSVDTYNDMTFIMADDSDIVFADSIMAFRAIQLADGGQMADFRKATGSDDLFVNIYPTVFGGTGNDTIYGRDQANLTFIAYGGNGKDRIVAGDSYSSLHGGLGKDLLTGGGGNDTFYFDTALKKNIDTIKKFTHDADVFALSQDIFTKFGIALDKAEFRLGSEAKDKNDFLIYDRKQGDLSYDVDGSGKKDAVQFAEVVGNVKLTIDDFFLV